MNRKKLLSLAFIIILLIALPVVLFLQKRRQDIRPRALSGNVNLLLSADSTDTTVGQEINVLVSIQLTDSDIRVSAVDFVLLYDKAKLEVKSITPNTISAGSGMGGVFTDAPIVSSGGEFDGAFKYLRVAEISNKPTQDLPGGTINLATVVFKSISQGAAAIKFPDNNQYIQIVGTSISDPSPTSPSS